MKFDRRLLENFNWVLFALVLALSGLGILNLYSAAAGFQTSGSPIFLKQIFWLGLGLIIMSAVLLFDYHFITQVAYPLYVLGVITLIIVILVARPTAGAQRWLSFGFFSLQPSEITKVFLVATLATYFSRRDYPDGLGFKDLVVPALLIGFPFLLIMRQPDLGTALHLAFACGSIILFLKVRWSVLITLGTSAVVGMPFLFNVLKDYQKKRLITFLDPEGDPLGAGYHIIQSKIAVGSGGFWGKGFLKGTQSQLRFLPEQHTDFAFSVFAEEWGFWGSLILITLYAMLIMTGLRMVSRSQDRFGAILALGLLSLIFWQILINISMVTGLMPVVGLPLPFISYGGSSMLTTYIAIGLILNVGMRRFLFQE